MRPPPHPAALVTIRAVARQLETTNEAAGNSWARPSWRLSAAAHIGTLALVTVPGSRRRWSTLMRLPWRAADQRHAHPIALASGRWRLPECDARGHAFPSYRALRQPDRGAAHARRRRLLRHIAVHLLAVARRRYVRTSARSCTRSLTAGISIVGGTGSHPGPGGAGCDPRLMVRCEAWSLVLYAIALLALIDYSEQTKADATVLTFAAVLSAADR